MECDIDQRKECRFSTRPPQPNCNHKYKLLIPDSLKVIQYKPCLPSFCVAGWYLSVTPNSLDFIRLSSINWLLWEGITPGESLWAYAWGTDRQTTPDWCFKLTASQYDYSWHRVEWEFCFKMHSAEVYCRLLTMVSTTTAECAKCSHQRLQHWRHCCPGDHTNDLKLHAAASDFSSAEPAALLGN